MHRYSTQHFVLLQSRTKMDFIGTIHHDSPQIAHNTEEKNLYGLQNHLQTKNVTGDCIYIYHKISSGVTNWHQKPHLNGVKLCAIKVSRSI